MAGDGVIMARDPETLAHLEWLGYVQPVGLVVSIPALLAAQCPITRSLQVTWRNISICSESLCLKVSYDRTAVLLQAYLGMLSTGSLGIT